MKITRTETKIRVESPYNPDLPKKARNLGGNWLGGEKVWSFDIRDEKRVEDLYRNIYGEWDSETEAVDLVDIKITAMDDISEHTSGIFFGPRQIARATGRDSGASLGSGIICTKGSAHSGGSVKNWRTCVYKGSVFEIKDIPLCKVKEMEDNKDWEIEILGNVDVDKIALEAEKAELLKRLAEIEDLLK